MSESPRENLRFVLSHLAERMKRAQEALAATSRNDLLGSQDAPPGVVFVLGAGCSMQYGMPGFKTLLGHTYDDLRIDTSRDSRWELDSLRDRLDPHWRTLKPEELRKLLDRHLRRIEGCHCTAYLRLARLACEGYIKAIVNMNFDLLLEQAFDALKNLGQENQKGLVRTYHPSKTFQIPENRTESIDRLECTNRPVGHEHLWHHPLDFHRKYIPLYIPHGSLRPMEGVPILDLAGSDLFDSYEETKEAEKLFRQNDVVFLGYRGSDAKVAAALTPESAPSDREEVAPHNYNQIYLLNIASPDTRLLRIMVARRSTELSVTGEIGAFENVMEELEHLVRRGSFSPTSAERRSGDDQERPSEGGSAKTQEIYPSRHFTRGESVALDRCRDAALKLRSSMSIAEGGQISIEKHADDIFQLCLNLAASCGVGLSTPEKYLLFCAAYLHDLGYFWAYSGNRKYKKAGWYLLATHGHDTATLLDRYFRSTPEGSKRRSAVLPESYQGQANELIDTIILLCHLHSGTPIPELPNETVELESRNLEVRQSFTVEIDGFPIPVRPPLLHALFHTAEEITQGHPFRPAPYPLEPHSSERSRLEDPVLDLYLGQKTQLFIDREFKPGSISVKFGSKEEVGTMGRLRRTETLLALLTKCAVSHLSRVIADLSSPEASANVSGNGEARLRLELPQEIDLPGDEAKLRGLFRESARLALDEQLEVQLDRLEREVKEDPSQLVGLLPTVLDLLSIYTDPIYLQADEAGELYRPSGADPGFEKARRMLETPPDGQDPKDWKNRLNRHLIYHYMRARHLDGKEPDSGLDRVFCYSFEAIYRPAWRFCADKWLYGVDALVMARASLDFGSSRYRDEVVLGMKSLMRDKITSWKSDDERAPAWLKPNEGNRPGSAHEWSFGHDGCTICTSRLLYILTKARQLLSREMREQCSEGERSLARTTGGLLKFFLRRSADDPAWLGIEAEQRLRGATLASADYVAWAAKASGHALWLDGEIALHTGGERRWLEDECQVTRSEVETLFQMLLDKLGRVAQSNILGDLTEEPHSYILGHVGGTYLFLKDLEDDFGADILPHDFDWDARVDQIQGALNDFEKRNPAQLSQFFLWPAEIFLARMPKSKVTDDDLVKTLYKCLSSRVWIKEGEGKGSWGYNIENTQRIVSSLNTFWSLAFRKPERFESYFEDSKWTALREEV